MTQTTPPENRPHPERYNPFDLCDPRCYKDQTDLTPLFNKDQLEAHFTHHLKYYDTLLRLKKKHLAQDWPLEKILGLARGSLQNNAAQYWYHSLYWSNLCKTSTTPSAALLAQINKDYGSLDGLKTCFISTALEHFSNGWYVCGFHRHYEPALRCMTFDNAITPMQRNIVPLIVVDIWEHAYYLQYKHERKAYLEQLWAHLDWTEISTRYESWKQDYKDFEGYWL